MVVQIFASFLGTVGYALMMRMKRNQIISVGIGGMITWTFFLLVGNFTESVFVCAMVASMFVGIYAEIMARVHKAPTTIFLTCGAIPLIPGGRLYYFISGILSKDAEMASANGNMAIAIVLGIAIGFLIVTVLNRYVHLFIRMFNRKKA